MSAICHYKMLKKELIDLINDNLNLNIINCEQHGSLFAEKLINRILSGKISKAKISIAKNENDLVKLSAYHRYQTFCKKPNSR